MAEPRSDLVLLLDMLDAAERAGRHAARFDQAGFEADEMCQDAVLRCLVVIGEAAARVSPDFRAAQPGVPWRQITGMRHRIVHDYDGIRLSVVWRVVQVELPLLVASLRPLIPVR